MKKSPWAGLLYAALLVLYLLHNDLWLWDDARPVFGLPMGLIYHVGFSLVTGIVLTLLVLKAWPDHLDHPADIADTRGSGH